jgi:uncharacterized protein
MKSFFTIIFTVMVSLAMAQNLFPALDTNYRAREIRVSSTLKMDVLFEGNRDAVWNGSQLATAKTWHDFTGLVPLGTGNDSCLLIVNHEMRENYPGVKDPLLGDGGGMTVFRVNKNAGTGRWGVVPYKGQRFWNVDFKSVRGTYTNCAGVTLPTPGMFMTAEETAPSSNVGITSVFNDTSDVVIPSGPFKGRTIKAFQNYGWMVAVDAPNAKALYKSYAMGRAAYEGGWPTPDGKTVYLGTDNGGAGPFLRFVADTANRFEYGQLQAYKQGANGVGGTWLDLPRDWDSLYNATTTAFRKGATIFTRLEWVVGKGNKIYITETGTDIATYKVAMNLGGVPSLHFQRSDTLGTGVKDSTFNDFYGRVLEFDISTNTIRPFVEGGRGSKFTFSNPDGISLHEQDGKSYLIVVEDINGTSQGRTTSSQFICEAFFLDLTIANPTLNDLRPFIAGASGGELTGSVSTPDGKTVFINSQHPYDNILMPSSSIITNIPPFNNDMTIAVTGFSLTSPTKELKITDDFSVYPNPAQNIINFNKTTDVSLYNITGQQIRIVRNANSIDVSDLKSGMYFLQTINGAVVKIVKE